MSNKYKRLGKNIFFILLGNAGSKLLNVVLLPFYTHWLTVEDYGITDLLNVYVMLLLGLCTASIVEAAFVFPKDKEFQLQKEYFSSGLFTSLIFLLISLFVLLGLSNAFIQLSVLNSFSDYVWLIYLMILAVFFQKYFQEFNRGINKMKVYSTSGIVLTLCTAIFAFIFIPKFGVNGYILSIILANFSSAIYSCILSSSYKYISFKSVNKQRYLEMLRYSVPLIPNGIMWWFIGYFNRPLIENYAGLNSVGLLAVANKFPTAIVMLFSVFFYSWQVSVLEEFDKKGYKEFYNNVFKFMLFLLCLGAVCLAVFSKYIIALVTAKEYHEAWVYIPLLAIAPLFQAISSFSGTNFSATKTTKYIFYASMIGGVSSVILNFTLIPAYGIWGAVISIILSHFFMALARVFYSWKYVKLTNLTSNITTLLLTILIALSVVYFKNEILKMSIIFGLLSLMFLNNLVQMKILVGKLKVIYGDYFRRS